MSLLFTSPSLFSGTSKLHSLQSPARGPLRPTPLSLSSAWNSPRPFPSLRATKSSSDAPEPSEPKPPSTVNATGDSSSSRPSQPDASPASVADEWGEKSEPEPESSYTKFTAPDPPKSDDEWTGRSDIGSGNGKARADIGNDSNWELKRCLVDSLYGTDLGFRASSEVRAEVSELINQLEAVNPTPNPTEVPELLNGSWILLYTAFSELLPLLAVGAIPLLKVERISQAINTSNQSVVNATTLSSPFATFSFSATATFEVRSPSRIQVSFKEGSFNPPEIKSRIDLPENVEIFGQTISLSPVQQGLAPVQEAVANLSRSLSGLPPLNVPIQPVRGNRPASWLLTTYLDDDLRISRGDGGIFVLAREGSPLLDQ